MQQQVQFTDVDAEIERAVQNGDLERAMMWCNSYTRLPTLLDLWRTRRISPEKAVAAVGEHWSGFDNIAEHSGELFLLLDMNEGGERKELMDEAEQEAYAKLPETVRGAPCDCHPQKEKPPNDQARRLPKQRNLSQRLAAILPRFPQNWQRSQV